jgi:nucleoside-diphosphate-sugar epimerase
VFAHLELPGLTGDLILVDMASTSSTVLVTGAFGMLGRRVVAELISRGHAVVAIELRTDLNVALAQRLRPAPSRPGSLEVAWVDLTNAAAVREVVLRTQPDSIVHLAAIIPPLAYRNPALARRVSVGGTANLLAAVKELANPPMFIECSSAAVHGARNPHRVIGRIAADTPHNPVDNYGAHKVECERMLEDSGLPHAVLRLGAIISPDLAMVINADAFVLEQSIPRDQRSHAVDVRDAALAFANAVRRGTEIDGKIFMIGGEESCAMTHRDLADDMIEAMGLKRLGPRASLPGNPHDDRQWTMIDWMDTEEAQQELDFQHHTWHDTLEWLRAEVGGKRALFRAVGAIARPVANGASIVHRRVNKRGVYADPWHLIERRFGPGAHATN